jgi:hypothetical protein
MGLPRAGRARDRGAAVVVPAPAARHAGAAQPLADPAFGDALHWPDLDEDLDVQGFLIGAKAPGATPPVEA